MMLCCTTVSRGGFVRIMPPARYFKQFGLQVTKTPSARFEHRGGESRAARHWEWRALQGSPEQGPDPWTGSTASGSTWQAKGKGTDKGKGKGKDKGTGKGKEKGTGQGKWQWSW